MTRETKTPGPEWKRYANIACNPAVPAGLALLDRAGLDHSGFDKGVREYARLDAELRRKDAEQRVNLPAREAAQRGLEVASARAAQLRSARINGPEAEEAERAELAAERTAQATRLTAARGTAEIQAIGKQHNAELLRTLLALAGSLETLAEKLGAEAAALVRDDLEFLSANPHRLPAEVLSLHRQAQGIDELGVHLCGTDGRGGRGFLRGAGEAADLFARAFGIRVLVKGRERPPTIEHEQKASIDRELGLGVN